MSKAMHLMHLKTIIYVLKSDKICIKICSKNAKNYKNLNLIFIFFIIIKYIFLLILV